MTLSTYQDRFDKADAAFHKAQEECHRYHAIWADACERLNRIERERLDAWIDLVAASAERPQENAGE